MASRRDPYPAFQFRVLLDNRDVAGFNECSGLQIETEVEEYQEGGENRFRHKLPKTTRYGNLTLRRGLTDSTALWDWYVDRAQEAGRRKSVAVLLWNGALLHEVWRWNLRDAYPVKWTGPDLKAETASLAIEAVEIAHHGIVFSGP